MKTIKTVTLFLLLLLSGGFALAQTGGGCYAGTVIAPPQPLGLGQPMPGATVRVCSSTATGSICSPLTPGGIFSDPGLTDPISNPFTADQNGNYNFCASQGSYLVQAFPDTATIYSFQVTVGIAPSGSYTFSGNNIFTGTNQFSGIELSDTLCTGALAGFSVLCATSAGPEVSINGASFLFMPTIAGDIGGAPSSPTITSTHITGGTVNTIPKFNATGNIVPSACTDNGSTVACTEPISTTGNLSGATASISGNATVGGTLGVTGTSTLGTTTTTGGALNGTLGATTPNTAAVTTLSASGAANLNGNTTAGNAALKNVSADHTVYLSPNGSDSNDGLSWGSAKLTPQAAFNLATTSGTASGTVLVATGSYSCPTTWYSNMAVIAPGALYSANYGGSFVTGTFSSGAIFSCTSGTSHTIDSVNNLYVSGIVIDFNNSGGGLILKAVAASHFHKFGVNLAGTTGTAAVAFIPGASGPANNMAFNKFYDLIIVTPNASVSADCLTMIGSGTPNAGPAVTNNEIYGMTCTGRIKNGIRFEVNSDTNKIWGVDLNNTTGGTGDALVFNSVTPASDQDSDNEIVMGMCYTGSFSHPISAGDSFGNSIQMCSGGGAVAVNVLGGTPRYNLETTGLFGVVPEEAISNLQINAGVRSGAGMKHQRFGSTCATAASAGATCTSDFLWTAAFPDNNYTFQCVGGTITSGLPIINSQIKSGSAGVQITIQLVALTAAAAQYTDVSCTAYHDPI